MPNPSVYDWNAGNTYTAAINGGTVAWSFGGPSVGQVTVFSAQQLSQCVTAIGFGGQFLGGTVIPTQAHITGILLKLQVQSSTGHAVDNFISVGRNGVFAANRAQGITFSQGVYQIYNYGSANDLWGLPWNITDFTTPNNNVFNFALQYKSSNATPDTISVNGAGLYVYWVGHPPATHPPYYNLRRWFGPFKR